MAHVMTVAIVDDAIDVRLLLRAQLQASAGFEVCAEGGDGREAVEIARLLRPDVMLLDLSMPILDGFGALPLILAASPATRVVILSGSAEWEFAERARGLGAAGCLEKALRLGPFPARLIEALGVAPVP